MARSTDVSLTRRKKRVRQKHGALNSIIYIRVPDPVLQKIIEIQERDPSFKYSTYLRPLVVKAINQKYKEVYRNGL